MATEKIVKKITGDSPGKTTDFTYYRVGPRHADKKVYLQAALHADEQPGILVLHHLLQSLIAADNKEELNAEFVLCPMVNPIGMGCIEFGQHQGRYDRPSGVNYNRLWPDLYKEISDTLHGKLCNDEDENKEIIRRTVKDWLTTTDAVSARDQLRHAVISEAYNADYVFDLHCDDDSLLHIFTVPQIENEMHELANWTGAAATLTAEDSGGYSFDEVWPLLWINAARDNPEFPIPLPIRSCTLEYRGQFDTFDSINQQDAHNLYGYFQAEGLIEGKAIARPKVISPLPSDLRATEELRAPEAGLLAYSVNLGDKVNKGDKIADLIHLDGEEAFIGRTPIYAGTDGIILSRLINKYVWPGANIAKIVGTEILASRDEYLCSD